MSIEKPIWLSITLIAIRTLISLVTRRHATRRFDKRLRALEHGHQDSRADRHYHNTTNG